MHKLDCAFSGFCAFSLSCGVPVVTVQLMTKLWSNAYMCERMFKPE